MNTETYEIIKKITNRINRVKKNFIAESKNIITELTEGLPKEREDFFFYAKGGNRFLKKNGAFKIMDSIGDGFRVLHFPDPHSHKMGGSSGAVAYVGYLVDDKLMGLIMEYSVVTEKPEYEVLKFFAYGEGRGACQYQEGSTYGPLNRSIKIAEGRCMVDTVINALKLPFGQDEDYVQTTPENVPTAQETSRGGRLVTPEEYHKERQSSPAPQKEPVKKKPEKSDAEKEKEAQEKEETIISLSGEIETIINTKFEGLYVINESGRESQLTGMQQCTESQDIPGLTALRDVVKKTVDARVDAAMRQLKESENQTNGH